MKRAPSIPILGKETVLSIVNLTNPEVRFVVSDYYASQEARKRSDMQIRHLGDKEMPTLLKYVADSSAVMEQQVALSLKVFADKTLVGRWCQSHVGIGPIITSGLLAHLDIEQAPTVGHFWSFAGMNPEKKWLKGEKRPWNADLKQLCYHLGECVKRTCNHENSVYGRLYKVRKDFVVQRNEAGYNTERAKTFFTNSAEVRKKLKEGKLPPGNLDRQACNYVAKIFLSHLHAVMYWDHYGKTPPKPFAIAIMGHAHEIEVPNADMFPGFKEAYYGTKPSAPTVT